MLLISESTLSELDSYVELTIFADILFVCPFKPVLKYVYKWNVVYMWLSWTSSCLISSNYILKATVAHLFSYTVLFIGHVVAFVFNLLKFTWKDLLENLIILWNRNLNVRYAGTIVTGVVELLNDISRNGVISMECVALVFQIPRTSMKSHQLR